MSPARALLALLLAASSTPVAATSTPSQFDLERIAATLRERGAVEIDVRGALALSGEWALPEGTITIRAGGGVVADDWHLVSPGSKLTLDAPGVHLRGRTHIDVAKPEGRGGSVALLGGAGVVEIGDHASIDASGATGQGGHIRLAANDVRARGALLALGRGLVEVDARGGLQFLSHTDTGGGLVRLDPTNLVINATDSGVTTVPGTPGVTPDDVSPSVGTAQLKASTLTGLLVSNDVIVHTNTAAAGGTGVPPGPNFTDDMVAGDISVEAEVRWTSIRSLTLLAHDNLILRAPVQNEGSGNVIGVAGWDGATLSGFAGDGVTPPLAATAYGALGGDVWIDEDASVAFGSRGGKTALWADNIDMQGSATTNAGFAIVGFNISDGTSASGPIQVIAHHDVSVRATFTPLFGGTGRYAQIGHGGMISSSFAGFGTTQGDLTGAITVSAGGTLLIEDAEAVAGAQIGHGGPISGAGASPPTSAVRGNMNGAITVAAATLTMNADDNNGARIGHGGQMVGGVTQGNIDGAITVNATSLTMTTGVHSVGGAQIGHGGSGASNPNGFILGNIGAAGGAPIVVTIANNVTLKHNLTDNRGLQASGLSQIGHGGMIFFNGNYGTMAGNVTVSSTAGNITLTSGGDCLNFCGSQIGHSATSLTVRNSLVKAIQGDVLVTAAAGTVSLSGGGVTPGGGQVECSTIGHGGPLFGSQDAFGGFVGTTQWDGAPAVSGNTNDVTVSAQSVIVKGGIGPYAYAQIGSGGLVQSDDNVFSHVVEGQIDGNVSVTATTGDLQVLAGADPNGGGSAHIGNGGQDGSPAGVTTVTTTGTSGAVSIDVKVETSLADAATGGSKWWLGHRTKAALTNALVALDTGSLDFIAGHQGGTTATIFDPTFNFWDRFAANPGPEKANLIGGPVTLRAHGVAVAEDNGDLISNQPLTVPAAITSPLNFLSILSTDDLTINNPVTNSGSSLIDFVADDANPTFPNLSLAAHFNLGAGGTLTGSMRLFAVASTAPQFVNGSGYIPPAQAFGIWYQTHGVAVLGANFKLAPPAPDLSVTKSDGGASVAPGGTVSYTLTYANTGIAATGVVLTETVPANTTFNAGASTAGWVCSPNNNAGSTCTLAVGSVAAPGGGNATFAVTVVNPLPAGVTQISNTASIADDGTNGTDPNPADNTGSDTTPVTGAPDLSVAKSDGGASVAPGGTASYTLTYANAGNRGAASVVLTETVPANTTFNAGASTAGWVCSPNNNAGSTCTLAIGTLAAGGGNQTATFAVTVVNPLPAGVTQISNTASIADDGTNGTDPTPANNTGSDTTPVTGAPDLSLTKSDGGASVAPGGTASYTLTYANTGNRGATGVVLTETVPANTTFNAGASTAGWVCSPNNNAGSTCTLAVGSLAGGSGNQTATFAVTVDNPLPGGVTQISNTASIADDGTNGSDPTPADNTGGDTTPVTGAAPDLSVTKSDGGTSVSPGGTVSYTLTYANTGNRGATGVVLTETVPANATFNAGASTAGWVCSPNNNAGSTCTLAVGTLAAGGGNQTATFAVTVDSPLPAGVTQISNTASIADDGTNGSDPTPADNTGGDTTPVIGAAPDLSVTKSDGGASVSPGGTLSYTLTYANTGNLGATGVVLTETVPANTTFNAGASTAGWVCAPNGNAGSTCTLAIGSLPAGGGNQTATFAVTVDNPLAPGVTQITNSASIADDGANGTDPTPGNNTGGDTTPVSFAPDLSLNKSDGGASVAPGGTVAYTLSYANSGATGATGVVLTDTVPANTTFNAGASTAGWVCSPDNSAGAICTLAVGGVAGSTGGSATFAVTVVNPLPAGVTQISNTASIADDGANGADPTPGNNTGSDTSPVTGGPDLSLTKSDGGTSVSPGGTVSYTLTYANTGDRGATSVVLTETVPTNTTFNAGASTAGWVCTPDSSAGSTCTLAIGTLAAGSGNQTATFAVTVDNPLAPGVTQITNTASIADDGTNGTDPAAGNNAGNDTTPVSSAPVAQIPTLSTLGLFALWLLLGALGTWMVRRQFAG